MATQSMQAHQHQPTHHVNPGQCGLCAHFGEHEPASPQLLKIRRQHEAPELFVSDCGHPRHAALHLKVTPISGCDGFAPAPDAHA